MARVPDVARHRFFYGTLLDTLFLISFNSGVFNLFYTIESVGRNCPHKAFTFVELPVLFFPLKTGEVQKKVFTSV